MPRDWRNYVDSVFEKLLEMKFIVRKVFRLRAYLYYKIPWMDTNDMLNFFLHRGLIRKVRGEKSWFAPPRFLDSEGNVRDEYLDDFIEKKEVYERWVKESPRAGSYFEGLVRKAFKEEGYSVQKVVFCRPPGSDPEKVEIDAFCINGEWHLGVQVKNITSDVIINPNILDKLTDFYRSLHNEFSFCSENRIVPILIAPFVERGFYVYCDLHRGLFCQTYFQFFDPSLRDLCADIRDKLGFGNTKVISQVPDGIRRWIRRIPDMWRKRHGRWR